MFNYSFWADEAYISGVALRWLTGKSSFIQTLNTFAIPYQRLYLLIISISLKIFGISEFSARLPSMIAFIFGIIFIFLLVNKLSNIYGAISSAVLYAFSNLNLAYATQAKPYAILETILLIILYLLVSKRTHHLMVIFLCIVAILVHSIGIFFCILFLVYLLPMFSQFDKKILKRPHIIAFSILVLISIPVLVSFINFGHFFQNNFIYQVTKLFIYKYFFISIGSFFGFVWLFKRYRPLSFAISIYVLVVLLLATFQQYIFNIRYVLTIFAIMFIYFGVFLAKIGERYIPKKPWIIPLIVMATLFLTGYKIVRTPEAYFNPNIDKYGDIQIANYKDFYSQLKKRFPYYKSIYVVNDTFDAEYWYFGRYSNAYFMKFTDKPYKHQVVNAMVYGSLGDFKKIIKDHPQGLLIMEDWQSFLPDDVKEYAKKNLKLEFRIESLKEAQNDPWPLALYSWGFN